MSTVNKGNKLEDDFYEYLVHQKDKGHLVFGAHPSHLCKIHKKKKYFSRDREDDVEFDIVVEQFREGRAAPHSYLIFECKNHDGAIQDRDVRDFSDKLCEIFPHANKGVLVVASRLQSGAKKLAQNRRLGVVKFDVSGLEVVLDRTGRSFPEQKFIESQIYESEAHSKSLKFSAFNGGKFYGSISHFISDITPTTPEDTNRELTCFDSSGELGSGIVPYVTDQTIEHSAQEQLIRIGYVNGPVDLERVCLELGVDLNFLDETRLNIDGKQVLGSANFENRYIQVNRHENNRRERFTIAHEIGHFCLRHDQYLASETIVEQDLLVVSESKKPFDYDRLECQANMFASALLLPDRVFKEKVAEIRTKIGIVDKGHGYIFVDDQPCNYTSYGQLLSEISSFFEVSMQAVEVKLSRGRMLNDQRNRFKAIAHAN